MVVPFVSMEDIESNETGDEICENENNKQLQPTNLILLQNGNLK